MYYKLFDTDLTIFDGDGGAAGTQAAPASSQQGNTTGGNDAEQGDASAIVENGSDAGSENTGEDRQRKYQEMVRGEFKDIYTQDTQRIINERFKETKTLQEQLEQHQPILESLFARYKVGDGDLSKLSQALESDDDYWSQAAEREGMTIEQYKQFQRLQRENNQFQKSARQRQNQEAVRQQFQQWDAESQAVKAEYPDFDLAVECRNTNFLQMLRSGVPVKFAYEVSHLNDIKTNTAKQTERQVVDNIRAKGARPPENGTSSQSGVTVKTDVSKLTKKDRAEIAKKAARGENIIF